MSRRRVVTGHDEDGQSVFVSDEVVEPITVSLRPEAEFLKVWGGDEVPTFPGSSQPPGRQNFFPPVNGYRIWILTMPPSARAVTPPDFDESAAIAEYEEKLPGIRGHMETEDPGMHATATADFEVMLSGELVLELDNGLETVLRQGDTVVQNGTRHRWHNRSDTPATFAVFMVGARFRR